MARSSSKSLIGSLTTPFVTIISFVAVLCIPEFAHAASSSFLGPIISDACNCPGSAPGWGCILATFQNLISFAVGFATIIITIFIAWAGFTYMTSGGSAEKRQLANKRLMNAVIGLLIVLCAYLLVDSIMKVIYNPAGTTLALGPWNSILGPQPGSDCFAIRQTPAALPGLTGANNAASNAGGGNGVANAGSATLSSTGTGPCSASTVQVDAQQGGYTLTTGQANELACIAQYESTCGTKNPPYNLNYSWNKATKNGSASSAAGAFQVLLSTNSACYNNAPCEQAGGTPGKPLNCSSGFSGGFPISGSAVVQRCEQAAGNTACSASAAACQLQHQSFSSMYGADPHAASCQSGS